MTLAPTQALGSKGSVILGLVTACNDEQVLAQRLLSSPDLLEQAALLEVVRQVGSAAEAFNPVMARLAAMPDSGSRWLVWLHQDVHLPQGWLEQVSSSLQEALRRWPQLAVAGVYGVNGAADQATRAGALLDRGQPLREAAPLPHEAHSLDECMLAVRVSSGLRMDPALGFDFYATDLCLQALDQGGTCAVVEAWCEHWSRTPRSGAVPAKVLERIRRSGEVFERKWAHRLPVSTPCFDIRQPGDVAAFLAAHTTPLP